MAKEGVAVKQLVEPAKVLVLGTVVSVSAVDKSKRVQRESHVVTVKELGKSSLIDVFINNEYWNTKGVNSNLFMGQIVFLEVLDCKKDATGYKETSESEELTAHTKDHKSFVRALECDNLTISQTLFEQGLPPFLIEMNINSINAIRSAMAKTKAAFVVQEPTNLLG